MSEFDYIPSIIVAAEFEATPHFTEGNEEPTIFYECVALLTQVAREWTEYELSLPVNRQMALYQHIRPAKGFMHLPQQVGSTWRNEITGPSLNEIAAKGSFWQVGLSGDRIHARYHREQWDSLPEDITAGWRPTLHDLAQKLWPDLAPSQEEPRQHDLSLFQSLAAFCDQQGYDISEWEQDHETEPQENYGTDEEPAPAGWSLDPQDWPNCCPFHGEYQSTLHAHAMPCGSVLWGQGFTVDVEGSRFTIWGECVEDNSDSDDDFYEEVCHACGEDKDDDEREAKALDRAIRKKSSRLKPLLDSPAFCVAFRIFDGLTRQCKKPASLLFITPQMKNPVCRTCAERAIDKDSQAEEQIKKAHPMFVRHAPMLDHEIQWDSHLVKPAWKKTVTERYYNYGGGFGPYGEQSGWEEYKHVFADFLDGRGIVMLTGPTKGGVSYWRPCKEANYSYDQGDLKVFFYGSFSRQWKIAKGPRAKVEEHYMAGRTKEADWTQEPEGYDARSWS